MTLTIEHRKRYRVLTRAGRVYDFTSWYSPHQAFRTRGQRFIPWADVERVAPVDLLHGKLHAKSFAQPFVDAADCSLSSAPVARQRWTPAERARVVDAVEGGMNYVEAASLVGCTKWAARLWHRDAGGLPHTSRDERPEDEEAWTPKPYVNPIRARALGLVVGRAA